MRRQLLLFSMVGFVALPGVTVLAEAMAWSAGQSMLPMVEALTGAWCHHDPARTLAVREVFLPVCARCTGLYGGLVVGPLLGWAVPWRGRGLVGVVTLACAAALIGLCAALAEAVGLVSTGNLTRLLLGLMLTTGPAAVGIVGARILAHALR